MVRTVRNPHSSTASPWLRELLSRKKAKVAIVAQANKTARIAWAVLVKEQEYRADYAGAAK